MIRRPPRSTQGVSSAASDVYKRQRLPFESILCASMNRFCLLRRAAIGRGILLLLLGGMAPVWGQKENPVVKTVGKEVGGKTIFLNPEFLLFPAEAKKGSKLPVLIYLHGAGGVGNDLGKIRGQARRVVSGIRKFRKGPCLCLLYTSPSPRDKRQSRMPSSA